MSKKLKILSTILMVSLLIILILQSTVKAEIINGTGRYEKYNSNIVHVKGTSDTTHANSSVFHGLRYSNVYCVEGGQYLDFLNSFTYVKTHTFKFSENVITKDGLEPTANKEEIIKFARGLAYIFSLENSIDRKKGEAGIRYAAIDDPLQLALHAYIKNCSTSNIRTYFAMTSATGLQIDTTQGTIKQQNKENYDWTETKYAKLGYQVYQEAKKAMTDVNNKYNFELYFFKHNKNDNQNLYVVKTATVEEGPATVSVNLTFKKQDLSSKGVSGVSGVNITLSKVTGGNVSSISDTSLTSAGSTGNFGTITVTPTENNGTFKIRVTETEPSAYMGIGYVDLTVKYNTSTGAVTSITENNTNVTSSGSTVTIKNRPAVQIKFNKQNFSSGNLAGAIISVEKGDNVASINKTTMTLGTGTLIVKPTNPTGTFKIKINETTNPFGHMGIGEEVTLTVSYDPTTGEVKSITSSNETYVPSISGNGTLIVKNKPKVNLTINKTDKETGLTISGAKFDVKIENVASVKMSGYSGNNGVINSNNGTIILEDVLAGKIEFEEIQGNGSAQDIKITLTETEAPTDYAIENPTTIIYIKQDYSQYKVNSGSWKNTSAGIAVPINITNKPAITLSGKVWEDGQVGDKDAKTPDGLKGTSERGLANVPVYVCNSTGTVLDYKNELTGNNKTDANGNYIFKDLPKTAEGYRVIFKYDGINYQETKAQGAKGNDSKANEVNRTSFNSKFKTIINGGTESGIKLGYDYNEGKSTLKSNIDGTNPANGNATDFQMTAQTGVYKTTTENLHCGLARKELDLAAVMQVDSTTLTINNKATKYNHDKTVIENLEELGISNLNTIRDNTVTTYLEYSDYYYRIEDYTTSSTEIKNEDPSDITTNVKELDVYVTYKLELINQTINNGVTINELAYYYDKNYTLEGIGTEIDATGKVINDATIKREALSDTSGIEKNAVRVSGFNGQAGNQAVIETLYFTFKVNKTEDGLPEAIKEQGLNCANIVEITSYSTTNSLIDRDSEPGNLLIKGTEDDSPQSNGLKIILKTTERTIEGTVFEDTNKDGILDEDDQKVDDVIVQLIEIRSKASGGLGEYIWQQTESGSNDVKSLTNKGTEIRNYSHTGENAVGQGEYKFTGFVPGNYIIRYIYGDGTTYDLDAEGNKVKYNGQDYKSTKDPNYQAPLYNTAVYADGSSVARDNEARRLEVMAYSTTIDAKIGQALKTFSKNMKDLTDGEKAVLNSYYDSLDKNNIEVIFAYNASKGDAYAGNPVPATLSDDEIYNLLKYYVSYKTWMSAETSMINVPIDTEETSIDTNSTQVGITYKESKVTFENMNFGLALRPNTKLVLEKHITGLKIQPIGTGAPTIVEATADITQILGEGDIKTKGITAGLATIESTRTERGFWKVEMDIEELAQGAQLEVEYTYVIKNEGEEDYLSYQLVEKYVSDPNNYSSFLISKSTEIKDSLKGHTDSYGNYLGQYYYTGNRKTDGSNPDVDVYSRVEGLEEALNNQLKYDDAAVPGDDFRQVNTEKVSRNIYDTDGNLVDNVGNGIKNIETVVNAEETSGFLKTTEKDYSKTIRLTTVLSSVTGDAGYYPSYIAEITQYSNAAGRRNMEAEPADLSYVHSEDTEITMASNNEVDEFWGEQIIISKPTGEDKLTTLQIAIITITSVAVIGAGIVLIKKFVLKK